MSRRLPLAVAAAAAVLALVAAPALAASPPPAYDIYTEQVPTASGPKPDSGPATTTQPPVALSPTVTAIVQREGGKDKKLLKKVATSPALGAQQRVAAPATPNVRTPSTLGAAFDLGSGTTALFALLLAAAALLAVGGGLWRRGRRQS